MFKTILSIIYIFMAMSVSAKPIQVTMPFLPGGATDKVWRTLLPMLNKELPEYEFITDYRPGAGGAIAAGHVSRQTDTHLLFTSSSIAISSTSASSTHKAENFVMLGYFGTMPIIFVASPNSVDSMAQFKKNCKTGNTTIGATGVGSTNHLVADEIMRAIDCPVKFIHYKGPGLAMTDLMTGRIDAMVDFIAGSTSILAKDGKIKSLMTISKQRLKEFPGVPTSKELGINLDSVKTWQVLLANANADANDIDKIKQAINRITADPSNLSKFQSIGLEGVGEKISPTFLHDNFDYYKNYIKSQ